MTQNELDILCVNTQSMLGLQAWELIQFIKIQDSSADVFTARHLALHGLMRSIKDYKMTDETLTDAQINEIQSKINLLLFQDKQVWDNSMPYKFGWP